MRKKGKSKVGNCKSYIKIFGQCLRETVEAAKRARWQGVATFGITGGDKALIARSCERHTVASVTRASFLDSYAASVAASNAILIACAHSQPKRSLEVLAQSDRKDREGTRWYQENESPNRKTNKT